MLFFVKATPYVVSATTAILFLLLIKFVEYRVRLDGSAHFYLLTTFIAILETKDKIVIQRKEEEDLRRTLSVSDFGL